MDDNKNELPEENGKNEFPLLEIPYIVHERSECMHDERYDKIRASHEKQIEELNRISEAKEKRFVKIIIVLISCIALISVLFTAKDYIAQKQHNQEISDLTKKYIDYLSEYDYVTETVTLDGADGTALYQDGEGNVLTNGEDSNKKKN